MRQLNLQRFNGLGGPAGVVLFEPAATNLALQSNLPSISAPWDSGNDTTVAANSTTAPDGTATASKILETATTSTHRVGQTIACALGTYTVSCYFKANGRTTIMLGLSDNATGGAERVFDLSNGTSSDGLNPAGSWTDVSYSMATLANGWYRCSVTGTRGAGTQCLVLVNIINGTASYLGDTTKGVYVWGAQLETGSIATGLITTTTVPVSRLARTVRVTR